MLWRGPASLFLGSYSLRRPHHIVCSTPLPSNQYWASPPSSVGRQALTSHKRPTEVARKPVAPIRKLHAPNCCGAYAPDRREYRQRFEKDDAYYASMGGKFIRVALDKIVGQQSIAMDHLCSSLRPPHFLSPSPYLWLRNP